MQSGSNLGVAAGAGVCRYQSTGLVVDGCIQYTGPRWTTRSATSDCSTRFQGYFFGGELCSQFEDPDYLGDCVKDAGTESEVRKPVTGPDSEPCFLLRFACTQLSGFDDFVSAGKCEESQWSEALLGRKNVISY